MKKIFLFIFFATLISTVFAKSPKKAKWCNYIFESEKEWVIEDSITKISFDIVGGDYSYVTIKVFNKTTKTIYIDLANTFLIRGEDSEPYYVPGQTVSTSGSSSGASVNLGSVAGAMGIGGMAGTLANGVNVGGGKSSSSTNVVFNQRVIAIPPMSAKVLEKKPVIRYFRTQGGSITVTDFGGVIDVGNLGYKSNPLLYLWIVKSKNETLRDQLVEIPVEKQYLGMRMMISYSQNENLSDLRNLIHSCYCSKIYGGKQLPVNISSNKTIKSILVSVGRRID